MKRKLSIIMALVITTLIICLNVPQKKNNDKDDDCASISLTNDDLWSSIDDKITRAYRPKNEAQLMSCSYNDVQLFDCDNEVDFLNENYDALQMILTEEEFSEFETAINNKIQYLSDGILYEDENGDLYINGEANYELQSSGISIKNVQRKIWKFKLPIGYDVYFGTRTWAYSFLTIAAMVDLISTITEISFIWMGGINDASALKLGLDLKVVNEARVMLNSLATYFVGLRDLSSNIAGLLINGTIPTMIFSMLDVAFASIMAIVKSGGVVGIVITTLLHIITPSVAQCFKIIKNCAEQDKMPILHYTFIKYDSYSLV